MALVRYDTNDRGLGLIKRSEGLRLDPYRCPAGVWTWGYGTTQAAGYRMASIDFPLTEAEAERMLCDSLDRLYEPVLEAHVDVDLTHNQFSALTSFVYNVGEGAFYRSTLRRLLNEGRYGPAADQLLRWVRGGGRVLPGLQKRRRAERELFLAPDVRWADAQHFDSLLDAMGFDSRQELVAQKVEALPAQHLPTLVFDSHAAVAQALGRWGQGPPSQLVDLSTP